MNDAAYTFNQTNRERSVTARGARHKRNGRLSKKCTLPSDHLTPAQKKGLNGTVETYTMNAPHTLRELKKWPADLRHEYMEGLLERYAPSNKDLASMLGYSARNMSAALAQYFGIKRDHSWQPASGLDALNAWRKFLDPDPIVAPVTEPDPEPEPVSVVATADPDPDPIQEKDEAQSSTAAPDFASCRLTGKVKDLVEYLRVLDAEQVYTFIVMAVMKEG